MKVAILGDSHLGISNDSPIFLEAYLTYFENHLFPYLIKNNIKTLVHLGDVLDRRKYINFNTLQQVRTRFSGWFKKNDVTVHCIIGNHDCYWKNTNDVNSCVEIFGDFFEVHEKPKDIILDGMICGFVPWITKENSEEIGEYLLKSNADVLFGHFELSGYEVARGVRHEGGMDPSYLSRFKKVYSGHFHCKQESGNIHYLGTPYDMSYPDVAESKGFHVLDTENGDLQFIVNPIKLYRKIVYDKVLDEQGHGNFNFSKYGKCFVKIVVTSKQNITKFDLFTDKLFDAGVHDLQIAETLPNESGIDTEDNCATERELSKNTIDLIDGYIDELKMDDGGDLKSLMRELYTESLSL